MKTLLLLAMMQVPADSVIRNITIEYGPAVTQPQVVVVDDTTFVRVEVYTDSLAAVFERGTTAAELALARQCGCAGGGAPGWFWGGALVLGVAGLIVWANREVSTTTINVDNRTETTTIVRTWPWKKKGYGR